jgi:hypothetical protein
MTMCFEMGGGGGKCDSVVYGEGYTARFIALNPARIAVDVDEK